MHEYLSPHERNVEITKFHAKEKKTLFNNFGKYWHPNIRLMSFETLYGLVVANKTAYNIQLGNFASFAGDFRSVPRRMTV